jgi:hypothetical protein
MDLQCWGRASIRFETARSMDLQYCGRASIRFENAAAVHEAAVNIEPNALMVDAHPPQPDQAYAAGAVADRVEAEDKVDYGSGLAVGALVQAGTGVEARAWAQAEPVLHYELEPGSRMTQGNTLAASLKSARAAPDL